MQDLSHYRVIRTLGGGSQGQALLAIDTQLMRRVVIKLFHDSQLGSRRRALELEARRLGQVEGARVVQALDVVGSGPHLALVLRYVPGCSLEDLLQKQGALHPSLVFSVVADIAAALAAARQQLLVHGDMKASNVLLGHDSRAILGDFAIARVTGRPAAAASLAALTPEHVRAEVLTQQSDFFALGALAYRLLCGRPPFGTAVSISESQLLAGFTGEAVMATALPEEVAGRITAWLRWMMAARPEDRPSGTVTLRNSLRDLRSQLPGAPDMRRLIAELARSEQQDAAAPVLPQRLRRPPRRERWWATLRGFWIASSHGARLSYLLSALVLFAVPLLYLARPGPCVEVLPFRRDVAPALVPLLPAPERIETHMRDNLRRWVQPVLVLGQFAGSDSQLRVRRQGVRDRCVAERSMQLFMRCWGDQCRLELRSLAPRVMRESALVVPATSGLMGMQQSVDQLMEGHLPALFPD